MGELPPLPKTLPALNGVITVSVMAEIVVPAAEAGTIRMGEWSTLERRIRIRRDMPLVVQWATLYHEQMHAWLDDTGAAHGLDTDTMERLCDAVACARLHELQERRTR